MVSLSDLSSLIADETVDEDYESDSFNNENKGIKIKIH